MYTAELARLAVKEDEELKRGIKIEISRSFFYALLITAFILQEKAGKYNITPREKEILNMMKEGLNREQIAKCIYLSLHTVKIHIKNIFQKLQADNRITAVVKALQYGLIEL